MRKRRKEKMGRVDWRGEVKGGKVVESGPI